jgi:hypothetical protein
MAENGGSLQLPKRKVLRRLYEPLLLLSALGQVRGERIKKNIEPDITEVDHTKARRSFADGLAYISSYDKDPDLVTAVALERAPSGVIVWLAANAGVQPKVKAFIQSVLNDLNTVAIQSTAIERRNKGIELYEPILTDVINFNEKRLGVYDNKIKKLISSCFPTINEASKYTGQ